uniref:Uncharacterized protein n=1 Tax=Arundo donax TaxID=35708 RepID=A0A0A9HMN6_ARUDO
MHCTVSTEIYQQGVIENAMILYMLICLHELRSDEHNRTIKPMVTKLSKDP